MGSLEEMQVRKKILKISVVFLSIGEIHKKTKLSIEEK
jgi:hypothetical protein